MKAIGRSRPHLGLLLDLALQDLIDGVPHARRAVVVVVVVGVVGVLRLNVPFEEGAQLGSLLRAQVEFLYPHRPVRGDVVGDPRLGFEHTDAVQHAAFYEAPEETLLAPAEQTVAVEPVGAQPIVVNQDVVVTVQLPGRGPGADRHEKDGELGAGFLGVRRLAAGGRPQREQVAEHESDPSAGREHDAQDKPATQSEQGAGCGEPRPSLTPDRSPPYCGGRTILCTLVTINGFKTMAPSQEE